ncbi:RHS repeat-associated core domain-containing protein [Pseudomonas reinekei]|jgi:RHS repeat-associated protein
MSNPKQPWLIRYSYDPLDQLIRHTQSDNLERQRFYCKTRLATEIQGEIGHSIVQHGDFLLAQQQRQQDAHDTTLLATDLQRSVLNTLKGNRQRAIAYSPYGHRRAESGLTSLLGFNGERPDSVTGHYLLGNGYRAFNPVLMRFNSPDSLSPFGKGGFNSYAYCLGDPINKTDANGRAPTSLLQVAYAKIIAGKFRINRILPRRKHISTPHFSLSPREILKSSDEFLQIKNDFRLIDQHLDSVFSSDLKNAKIPNLKNISAGRVNDLGLPLDNLPTSLQKYAKTPNLPLNSSDLLEVLASNPNSDSVFDYSALLSERIGNHPSGRAIEPSISKRYLKRLNYTVRDVRQEVMERHSGLLYRVTGRVYHG